MHSVIDCLHVVCVVEVHEIVGTVFNGEDEEDEDGHAEELDCNNNYRIVFLCSYLVFGLLASVLEKYTGLRIKASIDQFLVTIMQNVLIEILNDAAVFSHAFSFEAFVDAVEASILNKWITNIVFLFLALVLVFDSCCDAKIDQTCYHTGTTANLSNVMSNKFHWFYLALGVGKAHITN